MTGGGNLRCRACCYTFDRTCADGIGKSFTRNAKWAEDTKDFTRSISNQLVSTFFFLYKNLVYKNIKASNCPKIKNILRTYEGFIF